jgi:hypothetical protein
VLGRISLTLRIGLALVLIPLALLGLSAGWYFTRSWEPLNIPISLTRGHIRAEFDINMESLYAMRVELNPAPTRSSDAVNVAAVAWSVSKGKSLLASSTGEPALTVDVLEDQSQLNLYQPWLFIYEAGGRKSSSSDLGV